MPYRGWWYCSKTKQNADYTHLIEILNMFVNTSLKQYISRFKGFNELRIKQFYVAFKYYLKRLQRLYKNNKYIA